jgi:hypothetical protein
MLLLIWSEVVGEPVESPLWRKANADPALLGLVIWQEENGEIP